MPLSISLHSRNMAAMKTCYQCKQEKNPEAFATRQGKTLSYCIECYESAYGPLSEKRINDTARARIARKRQAKKCQEFIRGLLETTPCMDCGITDMIVLQFDHRNPEEKEKGISCLLAEGRMTRLRSEVQKCDIVCANCHIKRTAKAFGSWRLND